MELSDNPHPVGTKEHHRWIVDEYIPSLTDDQREQHRKRAGAEAIGGRLIDESRRFTFSIGDLDLSDMVKRWDFSINTPQLNPLTVDQLKAAWDKSFKLGDVSES